MNENYNIQQIHPAPFPSDKINDPPFKKSSKYPKAFETQLTEEIKSHDIYYTTRVLVRILSISDDILNYVYRNNILCGVIFISSLLFTLAHIGFEAFLIYYYRNEYGIRLFITILVITLLFFVISLMSMLSMHSDSGYAACLFCLYVLMFLTYFSLFVSIISYMNDSDKIYMIISIVLYFLGINLPGIYIGLWIVIFLVFFVAFLVEMIMRKLIMLCIKEEWPGMLKYYTYLYDNTKTSTTDCVICFGIFKDNEIGRAHV